MISLPRFIFIQGASGEALARALFASEPTGVMEDFTLPVLQTCEDLCLEAPWEELDRALRSIRHDFLGHAQLSRYDGSEAQMIYWNVRHLADVQPFARAFGLRECLVIRISDPIGPTGIHDGIQTVWLPQAEPALQLKLLQKELLAQTAPIPDTGPVP